MHENMSMVQGACISCCYVQNESHRVECPVPVYRARSGVASRPIDTRKFPVLDLEV